MNGQDVQQIPLADLEYPDVRPENETDAVKAMADRFRVEGIKEPVQINSRGAVIIGNEIARAARLAGISIVPCITIIKEN